MNISTASASAGGLTFAQTMQLRTAAKQAADARKVETATDTAKAMASPVFKAPESQKQQAKARLQQIMEWLKIVKKLYANDPKGMAKALAQVFKDLKSAVKAYHDAGGQEMAMSSGASGAVVSQAPAADAPKDDKPDEAAQSAAAPKAETDPASAPTPAQSGSSVYDAVAGEVRKSIGEDGLDFVKQVRGIVGKITELLDTARGQAAIRKRDKETDKAFEETDKELKSLHEEMDSMEQDIRREIPAAGMKLSIAA